MNLKHLLVAVDRSALCILGSGTANAGQTITDREPSSA